MAKKALVMLSEGHGALRLYKKPHFLKWYRHSLKYAASREEHFVCLLQLFKPWRDEEVDVKGM
jgi:hypothetical protein